jgi:Glycosyltransferase family 87
VVEGQRSTVQLQRKYGEVIGGMSRAVAGCGSRNPYGVRTPADGDGEPGRRPVTLAAVPNPAAPSRTTVRPLLAASAALAGLAALVLAIVRVGAPNDARWRLVALLVGGWLTFAAAAWLVSRVPARQAVPLIVAGGILLQALALTAPPRSTDDFYRYAWDGRVQAAGVDPYRYSPIDPALAALRDGWLFPTHCAQHEPPCTMINHPSQPTIYPPVAEGVFVLVHVIAPPGSRHKPWQVLAALLAIATTLALQAVLRRAGRDPRWAVLWAWCPAVAIEAGNSAHIDVLAVLLTVAGLGVLATSRTSAGLAGDGAGSPGSAGLAGGLLGAAVAVKLYPALVLPAALRRRGWLVLGSASGVVAASYLPHVLVVGGRVLGYLPGYLAEEGYNGTGRYPVLRLLVPYSAAPYVAVAVLAGTALAVARLTDPDQPWDGAMLLTGVAVLVTGPTYPWYSLLLVALAALARRPEWLAVAAAAYPPYLVGALHLPPETTKQVAYGVAAAAVLISVAARVNGCREHRVYRA